MVSRAYPILTHYRRVTQSTLQIYYKKFLPFLQALKQFLYFLTIDVLYNFILAVFRVTIKSVIPSFYVCDNTR